MAFFTKKNEFHILYSEKICLWLFGRQQMEWNDRYIQVSLFLKICQMLPLCKKRGLAFLLVKRIFLPKGMLERNEIDIAPADLTITKARSAVVDYLPGMTSSYQQLFIRNPAEGLNWKAYLEPFTSETWLVIILFVVFIPLIVAGIMIFGNTNMVLIHKQQMIN